MLAGDVRFPLISLSAIRRLGRQAAAVLLSLLLAGGPALAQGHGWGRGHGGGGEGGWRRAGEYRGGGPPGQERGYGPPPGRAYGGPPGRGYEGPPGRGRWSYGPPAEAYGPYPGAPAYPNRAPPGYGVRRGGMIPPEYRGAIVPDYGRHRLRPPPPGFAWVRMGSRYMLVSRSTGQIFDVIGQ
jgi:hypothetical protein